MDGTEVCFPLLVLIGEWQQERWKGCGLCWTAAWRRDKEQKKKREMEGEKRVRKSGGYADEDNKRGKGMSKRETTNKERKEDKQRDKPSNTDTNRNR